MRMSNSRPGCFASKSLSRCLRIRAGGFPAFGLNSGGNHIRKTRASVVGEAVPAGVTFDVVSIFSVGVTEGPAGDAVTEVDAGLAGGAAKGVEIKSAMDAHPVLSNNPK